MRFGLSASLKHPTAAPMEHGRSGCGAGVGAGGAGVGGGGAGVGASGLNGCNVTNGTRSQLSKTGVRRATIRG